MISIGNLTLGGTGKTPCVEYVARFYRQHDVQVAILSRGYGSDGGRNDEAMLLEENLPDVPHLQGPNRVELAATAVGELESELLVLDDGYQHRRLHRDLDVVLVDATNPWGYGYLFPRGALREPLGSLKRASVVMITRADRVAPAELARIRDRLQCHTSAPVVVTRHRPIEMIGCPDRTAPVEELKGKKVAGFCGIGNPQAFRKTLEDLQCTVEDFRVYPDHHRYTREDVEVLARWAGQQAADTIVATTQKDLVKIQLAELSDRPLWAVRIGLVFEEGQEMFDQLLQSKCQITSPSEPTNPDGDLVPPT